MTDPDRATQGSGSQTVPGLITPEKFGHPVAHGADATRVIPDHMERTHLDLGRVQGLAETGCVLEFDLFGWEMACCNSLSDMCLPNGGGRVRIIRRLIARGYGDRTVLSHDVCRKTRMHRYGGPGCGHISGALRAADAAARDHPGAAGCDAAPHAPAAADDRLTSHLPPSGHGAGPGRRPSICARHARP